MNNYQYPSTFIYYTLKILDGKKLLQMNILEYFLAVIGSYNRMTIT